MGACAPDKSLTGMGLVFVRFLEKKRKNLLFDRPTCEAWSDEGGHGDHALPRLLMRLLSSYRLISTCP